MPSQAARSETAYDLGCVRLREMRRIDPIEAFAPFVDEPYAGLLHDHEGWSYLVRKPDALGRAPGDLPRLLMPAEACPEGPPFQGGVLGLAAYELSAQLEARAPARRTDWPDLMLARYPALVAFNEVEGRVVAVGRGPDRAAADRRAAAAAGWVMDPRPPADVRGPLASGPVLPSADAQHHAAVSETVARIAAGEIFQANLARPWRGRLAAGRTPFDLFRRLASASPAPYAAYLRLPGRALVSNSPEQFLSVAPGLGGLWAQSQPIKGTRPRSDDPAVDAELACELLASQKDRAENLMIVDLMRNDLARVCAPGTVEVPELAVLRSYANVHHLVSRVRGRLAPGATAWDAFLAAFPPGSVTGAPKLQAMRVIADYEPPRGPYCGSLFWAGCDGRLDASVLIRTVALVADPQGWTFEARAGGGVVADSDPAAEVRETSAKISAILRALVGDGE